MEADESQFASNIGSHHPLPSAYKLSDFLKERMEEVVMFTEALKESPFRGQTFQRLPKHMRRRQMSHYFKRLPRSLRQHYLSTLKDGLPTPTKRHSRKYRRRPNNLLLEYNRRQKNNIWLETHIWHAKRFHMIQKWGYKLPEKPANKNFRACYRAISEHCLLIDISYYNCIELRGSEAQLLDKLGQCTSTDCGLTFGAKMYLCGSKEGVVSLFHPNSYPYKMIGNITFIWKPFCAADTDRKVWIWCHPSIHDEIVECFKNLFDLTITVNTCKKTVDILTENLPTATVSESVNHKSKKKIEEIKLEPKNVPFCRTPKYKNKDNTVLMTLLKDTLNRFQLIGPLSHTIVFEAFVPVQVKRFDIINSDIGFMEIKNRKRKFDQVDDNMETVIKTKNNDDGAECTKKKNSWWEEYYKKEDHKRFWENQKEFYDNLKKCSKPTDVPPGLILSLVIGDPRLKIPKKREKIVPNKKEFFQISESSHKIDHCQSPIWDSDIRDEVSMTKLNTEMINKTRSKKIIPGSDVDDIIPDEMQSRIPILLIQRPGIKDHQFGRLGLGSGWDIVFPAGFGMPFWHSLIFRGARPGGLRDVELLFLECYNLNGYIQPDSAAGIAENSFRQKELHSRYFRLPPNKRPNYIKLAVPSPFFCPWNVLVGDWIKSWGKLPLTAEVEKFRVLRNKQYLEELNEMTKNFKNLVDVNFDNLIEKLGVDCLVPVAIECVVKGKPKELALICLPDVEDISQPNGSHVKEPQHPDDKSGLRKILKSEHKKLLASLRRKRKKERLRLKEKIATNSLEKINYKDIMKINVAPSEKHISKYKAEMESLWIPQPDKMNTVINYSSKKILGFVIKGDFSFSKSISVALGYVTIVGLIELFKMSKINKTALKVLVRNRNHVQYRLGELKILYE